MEPIGDMLYNDLKNTKDLELILYDPETKEARWVPVHRLVLRIRSPFFYRELQNRRFSYVVKLPYIYHMPMLVLIRCFYLSNIPGSQLTKYRPLLSELCLKFECSQIYNRYFDTHLKKVLVQRRPKRKVYATRSNRAIITRSSLKRRKRSV